MEFSPQQKRIIHHQDGNLLVSAAAGAGKTTVLVERVLNLMMRPKDPVRLDQMLIVTFTRLAADQMKTAIEERISRLLGMKPNPLTPYQRQILENQLSMVPLASISTNDAFALKVLKEHIVDLDGIEPGFRVADETEAAMLHSDCLQQVMESFYQEMEPLEDDSPLSGEEKKEREEDARFFSAFLNAFGSRRSDDEAMQTVLSVYSFILNDPDPMGWFDRSLKKLDPDEWPEKENGGKVNPFEAVQAETKISAGKKYAQYLCEMADLYRTALQRDDEQGGVFDEKDRKKIEDLQERYRRYGGQLTELFNRVADGRAGFDEADALVNEIAGDKKLKNLPGTVEKVDSQLGQTIRDKKGSESRKAYLEDRLDISDDMVDKIRSMTLPALKGLRRILVRLIKRIAEEKKARNIQEFSDFEHGALKILSDPEDPEKDSEAALEYQKQYRYIFIDEYQDSNRLQDALIHHIARKDKNGREINVFMVGDIKQSIYGFRHADCTLFASKYHAYTPDPVEGRLRLVRGRKSLKALKKSARASRRITLNKNYRSHPLILDSVNYLFYSLMADTDIAYTKKEALNAFQPVEKYTVKGKSGAFVKLYVEEASSAEMASNAEQNKLVEIIRSLHDEEGYEYKDIVVLLRSMTGAGDLYNALSEAGIPVYCSKSDPFYDTLEIRCVMNILRVLDNPLQDIPLYGAMMSPAGQFTEEELSLIRLASPGKPFYEAVAAYSSREEEKEAAVQEKVKKFLDQIDQWRRKARYLTIHELLWEIYVDSHLYLWFSSMPDGLSRRANLDLLLQKSQVFEQGTYHGLYAFLRYVEQMNDNQEEASQAGAPTNLVRITTIHKSKGLQFPVVILANMGKKFNMRSEQARLLMDQDAGFGPALMDVDKNIEYPSLPHDYLQQVIRNKDRDEEMRLLYVALTRACEGLIMLGSRTKEAPPSSQPSEDFAYNKFDIYQAQSFLDWVETITVNKSGHPYEYVVEQVPEEEAAQSMKAPADAKEKDETIDRTEMEVLENKLGWEYKELALSTLPQLLSVSSFKEEQIESGLDDPSARERVAVNLSPDETGHSEGALRGTAFHTILAQCHLEKLTDEAGIQEEIERLVKEHKLTRQASELVPVAWIRRFGASSLYQRIMMSEKYEREQPFILSIPVKDLAGLSSDYSKAEQAHGSVMIQGIIDLYFKEKDGLVLVDYKTDAVLTEERLNGYRTQIGLYERALNASGMGKVKEKMLYQVRTGKVILC